MIKVRCRTNLDKYAKTSWPTEMCCRPRVGDCVQSVSGCVQSVSGDAAPASLKIVAITHSLE